MPAYTMAVRECVDRCERAEYPLSALSEFLRELRADDWSESDVRIVERSVLSILFRVFTESDGR